MPIEGGRAASRFLEVLKYFCVVFLDVSIIKVRDQNLQDYCRVRENIESEFEFIGHPLSDAGFKKLISRCMKYERFCLHKLFTLRPDRGCPPIEQPGASERLKTYWNSPEFARVKKVGSMATQTATSPPNVPVRSITMLLFLSGPCVLLVKRRYWFGIIVSPQNNRQNPRYEPWNNK